MLFDKGDMKEVEDMVSSRIPKVISLGVGSVTN